MVSEIYRRNGPNALLDEEVLPPRHRLLRHPGPMIRPYGRKVTMTVFVLTALAEMAIVFDTAPAGSGLVLT
jgi:hypothetical protein